jgi:hypothetical protein
LVFSLVGLAIRGRGYVIGRQFCLCAGHLGELLTKRATIRSFLAHGSIHMTGHASGGVSLTMPELTLAIGRRALYGH